MQTARRLMWLFLSLVFCITLAVTLAHHFYFKHTKVALIFDSVHYLSTCQYITSVLISTVHGNWQPGLLADRAFWDQLSLDGPILTTLFALLFTMIGHVPRHCDWPIFVIGQSVIHSMSAVLICMIAFGITRNKVSSIIAGLLWGLYPAAVIASGRFLTETPAVFLILAFVTSIMKSRTSFIFSLLAGFSAGLLIMLKPALVPSVVPVMIWILWFIRRQKILRHVVMLACAVLVIVPWACYTQAMTGKIDITVQRLPAYHFALGSDIETDGWGSGLLPPLTALISNSENHFAPVLAQWSCHSAEMSRLAIRKIYRLFANPWNDFRHSYFGLTASGQQLFHLGILVLAIFAVLVRLSMLWQCRGKLKHDQTESMLILISILIVGQTLTYLMVDSISRYAFTIMPLLFVFVSVAIKDLINSQSSRAMQKLVVGSQLWAAAMAALAITTLVAEAEDLTRLGQSKEVEHKLSLGDKVKKCIDLSQCRLPKSIESALVLIDGDKRIAKAAVEVNGHKLSTHLLSIYQLNSLINGGYELREQAVAMDLAPDDLRQWRAAIVPYCWLRTRGLNSITVFQLDKDSTIYGDSDSRYRFVPSLDCCVIDKMCISPKSLDGRIINPVMTGRINEKSWLSKSGLPWLPLADSLRIKLALVVKPAESNEKQFPCTGVDQFEKRIYPCDFDPVLGSAFIGGKWVKQAETIRVNKYVLKAARNTECRVPLPRFLPSTHLHVQLAGEVRCMKEPGHGDDTGYMGYIGIPVALANSNGRPVLFNRMPTFVHAGRRWQRFILEDLMTTKTLGDGGPKELVFNVYPCPWQNASYGPDHASSDAQLRNLSVKLTAVDLVDIAGKQMLIY